MVAPNFAKRTLCHGDNLELLLGMNSETLDLIVARCQAVALASSSSRLSLRRLPC